MTSSLFLQAFHGKNKRVPVWFMRQAGRYLPEYQAIRQKYSLAEMFHNPQIAAEITCLPVAYLNVDAAILFADILTLPSQMGFDIQFNGTQGPFIANPIVKSADVERIYDFKDLSHIEKIIKLVNQRLPQDVPLIGFAGSPFTVLCYLIEGGSAVNFIKTLQFAYAQPQAFHQLMKKLTRNTIQYLQLQKNAGIKVFQIFDTWGGILRREDFQAWNLPYLQQIFDAVDLPSMYYLKNSAHVLDMMEKSRADVLSVCHTVDLNDPRLQKTHKGIQGNLYNALLYADYEILKNEILKVLKSAQHYKKYIFNLSHGIFPNVDVEKLKFTVEVVHGFSWDQ